MIIVIGMVCATFTVTAYFKVVTIEKDRLIISRTGKIEFWRSAWLPPPRSRLPPTCSTRWARRRTRAASTYNTACPHPKVHYKVYSQAQSHRCLRCILEIPDLALFQFPIPLEKLQNKTVQKMFTRHLAR